MRALVCVLAGLLIAGCSPVYSRGPLFGAGDTAERPKPRPGLWIEVCTEAREETLASGPCGIRLAIAPGRVAELDRTTEGPPKAARAGAFRIIRGDPLIVELRQDNDSLVEYGWLRDLTVDRRGVATRFTVHAVACRISRSGSLVFGTRGMEDDITDNVDFDRGADETGLCIATTADQVRKAVRLNQGGQGDSVPLTFRFERDLPELDALVAVEPPPPPGAAVAETDPAAEAAPEPKPEAEPTSNARGKPAQGAWVVLAAMIASALAFAAAGLVVRGRWRWGIKPAAGFLGGYAAAAALAGPAVLPALLWTPVLPVAVMMVVEVVRARGRGRGSAP